ncbi:MAG: (Fe-S)-binding protein [Candidatus Dormibacteraeota bacterium]|nr:(Fe-S)-binding protein [Candidatus Dormibacteraeota bacterium]
MTLRIDDTPSPGSSAMSAGQVPAPPTGEVVHVFTTCLVDQLRPDIGAAVFGVLRRYGYRPVPVRGGTCCGQPAWNTGLTTAARRVARHTLRALAATTGPVIVPSGSCATMMIEFWPELFRGTRDEAAAIAAAERVTELSAFLGPHAASSRVADGHNRVVYHDSCHMLRELGIHDAPRRLLAADGITVVDLDGAELCCGFGGTFSVKLPEISTAMADEKLDAVVATGVRRIVGCDYSCMLHLQGRAERRGLDIDARHIAEVLDGG